MKITKTNWIGIVAGIALLVTDFILFFGEKEFFLVIGISVVIIVFPFVANLMLESKKSEEVAEKFLEFSRNLSESVGAGTPISKSIINMSKKDYGPLTPYIRKLANQISIGVPVHNALQTFSYEIDNHVISRAVALIIEAERAGGEIEYVLESVASSIAEVEKLKKERKAAIYNLVVQGYIIFIIFLGIMLIMEFKILPLAGGIGFGSSDLLSISKIEQASSGKILSPEEISQSFLYLLIVQGAFAGLVIGKLAEGSIRSGIKHSFILVIIAFLVSTGARVFLG